jgi:hypothetical protein
MYVCPGVLFPYSWKTRTLADSTVHCANWLMVLISAPSRRGIALIPRASQQAPHSLTCPPLETTGFTMRSITRGHAAITRSRLAYRDCKPGNAPYYVFPGEHKPGTC